MLTNTERQQIVEEVNAGTYGIDEALDDIAAAQKGEEVRKALYAEALVLNREGHAGSTDMIARQRIANLQTSVSGQISTLRSEVGDDIDDLEAALNSGLATQNGKIAAQNATIANVVANYNVEYGSTELWASTGETGALAAGTTVTLSEDVSHFDYIDIYSFCGNSNVLDTVPVDAKLQSNAGYALRWVNLSDPDSGSYKAYVRIIETRLHIIGTTLTIDHQVTYRNGEEVNISGAEITQSNRSTYVGELGIMKVVGRKITANTEIEDVRIGADGTEYASAGQAVRAQVNDLKSVIPAIDTTLSISGSAADAKTVGDALAEANDRLQVQADDVYSKAVSKNLMGMEIGKYYPVDIPQGTQLVITRSDGSAFPADNVERLYMYDADRRYVDYVTLKTGMNYKVTAGMKSDVAYLRWYDDNGGTYGVPMMVVTYVDRGTPYAEYFENVRQLADRYDSGAAEISGEIESLSDDVYANAVSKNLMGMDSKMYRVDLSAGDFITVSKQDESIFDTASTQKLYCFDDKKKWVQSRYLNHGGTFETFILTKDIAYLQWNVDDLYPLDTPMMVAKGNKPLGYTEYFETVKTLDDDEEATPYYSQNSATSYGVTFSWADNVCTISGTANNTGYSVNNYLLKSSQNKPLIFEVGKKLYIHYHVTSPAILFEIDAYKYDEDSGTYKAFDVFVMRGPGWYTVPAGTERLALSIRIQDGTTIIGKFSDFGIFETYPKKRIEQCPNLPLLITLTDDDTLTDEDVEHFHGCLMHNGVQGGYAFIGRRVEEAGTTTIAKMQEVEDDGFDVLPHCWTQATYFLNGETRNIAQCMSNMVKIKRYMAEHQLMSQDQWIVPYGVTDEGIRHVAKSLGFKMMFSSATKDFNRAIDTERYRTKRVGFHPTWTEQSNIQLPELKSLVDKMVKYGGGWLIVCCHVKDWNKNNWPNNPEMWVEFDETLDADGYPIGYAPLNEFISYARSVGCTFVNVREGYRWIEPYLLDT